MTYKEAAAFVLPFGMNKSVPIDAIAGNDSGLRYLDWLRGQLWVHAPLLTALNVYLNDPTIARELAKAMEGGR